MGAGVSQSGALAPAGTSIGVGGDSGSEHSVTSDGISGVAGDKTVRTGDAPTGVAKIFDAARVEQDVGAQVFIMQTFTREAPRAIARYADTQVQDLLKQAGSETDLDKQALLRSEAAHWAEGGTYRVALHAATGAVAGGLEGALGAGTVAAAAPLLNDWQRSLTANLQAAGVTASVAQATASLITGTAAAGIGAVASGGSVPGAVAGVNVDANNRQLHRDEMQWIKQHTKRFAANNNISDAEAERRLAQQAYRQVQFGAEVGEDAQARTFLSQAHGMLTADPHCPTCGPGYLFYATPDQKANVGMYATQVVSDPTTLAFYAKNGITQPTTQQVRQSVNQDANTRTILTNATLGAAGVAVAATVPPALSWCLSNPVACNRIVIAGGEIAAGDALGPAGLGVTGTAFAVKAVRSADEVNAAMKARGWEPAWSSGTPVIETILQPGTKVNMIVDAKTAEAIRRGHIEDVVPGGWATFDDASTVATDMRQRAAITNQFKQASDGPFYVIEMEITQPVKSNIGFVGKQTESTGGLLRGGGTQVQFDEAIKDKDRQTFLRPVSSPRLLN